MDSSSPVKKTAQNDDNLDDLFGSMVSAAPSMPSGNQQNSFATSFPEVKSVDQISSGLESLDFNAPSKGNRIFDFF